MTRGTSSTPQPDRARMLTIYLNDHLAGATVGAELARRSARNSHSREIRHTLRELAHEVEADRKTLRGIIRGIGLPLQRYKEVLGWIGEKVGRLKSNGRLYQGTWLSVLLEVEMLRLGVTGKAAMWRSLRAIAERDPRLDIDQLNELIARAQSQVDDLERVRIRAVSMLFDATGEISSSERERDRAEAGYRPPHPSDPAEGTY